MTLRHDQTRLLDLDAREVGAIAVVALLFAFALTFRMWGEETFNAGVGALNLVVVSILMLFAVLLHEGGHKIVGALEGYMVRVRMFGAGLVASLVIIVYSQGWLPIVTPNLTAMDARPDLRLRSFRKYENPSNMARIAIGGLAGTTVAIVALKTAFMLTGYPLLMVAVKGAVLHGVFSLLPFELLNLTKLRYFDHVEPQLPGDGMHILWWSLPAWFGTLVFMVIFGGIALFTTTTSYFVSLVIALFSTYAFTKWR